MSMSSWTQQNLTNIEQAIASGQLTVEIDGQRVTYRSMKELQQARNMIMSSLGVSPTPIRQIRFHPRGNF
jgi:hypothetical protein